MRSAKEATFQTSVATWGGASQPVPGSQFVSPPAASSWGTDRYDVFAYEANGHLGHLFQNYRSGPITLEDWGPGPGGSFTTSLLLHLGVMAVWMCLPRHQGTYFIGPGTMARSADGPILVRRQMARLRLRRRRLGFGIMRSLDRKGVRPPVQRGRLGRRPLALTAENLSCSVLRSCAPYLPSVLERNCRNEFATSAQRLLARPW